MSFDKSMKFVVKDAEHLSDVVLSKSEGGRYLDSGLGDRLAALAPTIDFDVRVDRYSGLRGLIDELESESPDLVSSPPQIILLSLAAEMERLGVPGRPTAALGEVRADLVDSIRRIKTQTGAHIFVANVSTLDPANPVFTYHGVDVEPWTLRAHRLNLMLIGVSHDEGVSIVDIDRKIADVGGSHSVIATAEYSESGCEAIVEEIVRIVEDYGFLDDRPLMQQVGAASS